MHKRADDDSNMAFLVCILGVFWICILYGCVVRIVLAQHYLLSETHPVHLHWETPHVSTRYIGIILSSTMLSFRSQENCNFPITKLQHPTAVGIHAKWH